MKDTLLIYSGGLDSSSALYIHKDSIGLAVSFNYGSNHNQQEIKWAAWNCKKLGIPHMVIDLAFIKENFKSALLGQEDIPHGHYEEDNMSKTVVPFRNGIMLSIAAGLAESKGLTNIMLASHKGDNAQYPDCTPAFNSGMRAAVFYGTSNRVELVAPFAYMDKLQIAEEGLKAGMQPEWTYSCYEGDEIHCGKCGTCVERIWALKNTDEGTQYKDRFFAVNLLKEKGQW